MANLFDIQASIKNYQAYAMQAAEITKKLEGRICYYDNLKHLNDYQAKSRKEAAEVVAIYHGLQNCTREMIGFFEMREAEAWQTNAESGEQSIEYAKIMQQKYAEKCKELEEIKREAEETQEMLQLFIKELAA